MSYTTSNISERQSVDFLDDLKEIVREEKQREAELANALTMEEEARKKEAFIMNISYAMRSPLNMIMGFTQVLSEMGESLTADEKTEMGEHIRKGTETLTEQLNEVLQFTRLESGRVKMTSEEIWLQPFISDIVAEHQHLVKEGVQLTADEGDANLCITSDAARLKEILHLYIENAAQHTTKGRISVGWHRDPASGDVLVHVTDTGCGIKEENQPRVFSLFWKENEFSPGAGIGLTLVKKYAELMGARLHFRSRYGEGSDFGIVLPATLVKKP